MTSTASAPPAAPDSTSVRQSDGLTTEPPPPDPTAELWALRNEGILSGGRLATRPGVGTRGSVLNRHGVNPSPNPVTFGGREQATAPARFDVLQKWEGVVTAVNGAAFGSRLIDLTGARADQEAEISINEVSPRDRSRLKLGAVFYWYIGYRDEPNGDRERASRIRFRRLPPLTDSELQAAERTATELRARLGWH